MKINNIKKITIISITIIIIFINLVFIFFYKNKAISIDKFKKISTSNNLKIKNVKEQFNDNEIVLDAYVAYNKYGDYQIEFIIFKDEIDAKKAFSLNKESFIKNDNSNLEYNISNNKTSRYSLTTTDKYMYISRKQNTLIFVDTNKKYKDIIINIISKMKY